MAVVTTWWRPEQGLIGLPSQSSASAPRRGTFGGQCFHMTCRHIGADWYNTQDRRYYCDEHARKINEHCEAENLPKLCALHL
jgi:hypothetical protein